MRRNRKFIGRYNCWFVTTTMTDWLHLLINDSYYAVISESMNFCVGKYAADVCGYVWMPNHIHCLLFFNEQVLLPGLMRDFKKYTSQTIRRMLQKDNDALVEERLRFARRTQDYKIWMDRYDAVPVWSREVVVTKLKYIHENPVKRGLSATATEYRYSSARYYADMPMSDSVKVRHIGTIL